MEPFAVNIIAAAVLILAVSGAIFYICKAKKNGKKCIGCPEGCRCSKNGCSSHTEK